MGLWTAISRAIGLSRRGEAPNAPAQPRTSEGSEGSEDSGDSGGSETPREPGALNDIVESQEKSSSIQPQNNASDKGGHSGRKGSSKPSDEKPTPKVLISPDPRVNEQALRDTFGKSDDVVYRSFICSHRGVRKGLLVSISGLAEGGKVDSILRSAIEFTNPPYKQPETSHDDPILDFMETVLHEVQVQSSRDLEKAVEFVLTGGTAFFLEGSSRVLLIDTKWNPGRSVAEPNVEAEVRGPRDGFVEHIRTNGTLIRRRIRDPRLRMEGLQVGARSKTNIALAYIEGLANDKVINEVRTRIQNVQIDGIIGSGTLQELIQDSPRSPFEMMHTTERPDRAAAALLEGRFVIIVDNTPFVLIAPITLWNSITAPGDYYQKYWTASFFRILRFTAMILALSLPSLYVLLTTFHHEMIPTPMALAIASGREGTPLPTVLEVLFLDIMFEILHEAGLRLPRAVGQTVSIVGTLVIGQAAVQAGLIAPSTIIVIAATGLTVFAIPSYPTSLTLRMLRFPLLLASGTLGVFGFLMGTTVLAFHLGSLRSFGAPYLGPLAPMAGPEMKDTMIRAPWWSMQKRPRISWERRTRRMPTGQEPKPPQDRGGDRP